MNKTSNIYYVYSHRHPETGEIFYIGKGCKGRAWDFATRSKSHKDYCNALFYKGYLPCDFVYIEKSGMEENDAIKLENELILACDPRTLLNKVQKGNRVPIPEIVTMYKNGLSYEKIAKALGIHSRVIKWNLDREDIIPPSYIKKQTKYCHETMIDLYQSGVQPKNIAEQMECSLSLVCSVLKEKCPSYKGYAKFKHRKCDPSIIANLRESGMKWQEVADSLGLKKEYVRKSYYSYKNQS